MIAAETLLVNATRSGELAYRFGNNHFDAASPNAYDLESALYFLKKADAFGSRDLYLHHQIARMYFLRGEHEKAMREISVQISVHGDSTPNSYYVRGLIEGYMGDYDASIADYRRYLESDPGNWAANNDYAWVLLKAGRIAEAQAATENGLAYAPSNPWLLNSNAIARFETGDREGAWRIVQLATAAANQVTEAEWLTAYPGNDPRVAGEGIAALQKAITDNMHTIMGSRATTTVQ